jgi:hypothetical protein
VFNKRDYAAAAHFWSSHYIQHSAHIAPGREGLFNLIESLPPTLKCEPGTIVAEGDFVIVRGRYSNIGLPVKLDCGGHSPGQGRHFCRALGCDRGPSLARTIQERPSKFGDVFTS